MSPAAKIGLLAPAGLIVGALVWAANTQLGQILPYWTCGQPFRPLALVAFLSALLSLGAGCISWRASRSGLAPHGERSAYPASFGFVGLIAAMAGLVFAYALMLQGLSALVLSGCER